MKRLVLAALTLAVAGSAIAQAHYRNGYVTKQGVYVPPSYATNPNDTKLDNFSTKGNFNPYTGKAGTVDPYRTEPYRWNVAPSTIKPIAPIRPLRPLGSLSSDDD